MQKITHYIDRTTSVFSNRGDLELLKIFKDFPIFFGCVTTPQDQDAVADMVWAIDRYSGVIQLTKLIPLELLYQAQHVDGCGPTWQKYYDDFAMFIQQQNLRSVLEIGGGAGELAKRVTNSKQNMQWTIVEPHPTLQDTENIHIIPTFFEKNFKLKTPVDAVVFSQVLEHAYQPREFLRTIRTFLKPHNKLIFAYPNLELWFERKYTNSINFEHTMLLTDRHLDVMLPEEGLSILKKSTYKDHSFFYVAEAAEPTQSNRIISTYELYKDLFDRFNVYHMTLVSELNEKINTADAPVYIFGAHIFTTYLIAFGLATKSIISLLDNSPTKRGKRLYGTNLFVESPEILSGKGRAYVILKAGIYNEEIKKDILENINSEIKFW